MKGLRIEEISKAVNGEIIIRGNADMGIISDISSDTRTIREGALFIAIKGENSDGHNYLDIAFEKGAGCAIVESDEKCSADKAVFIKVRDTRLALGDLANYYRGLFDIPLVALTGSTGKTTTKDMIASVLRQRFRVCATDKNFNNDIGVPKTLFGIEESDEVAVVEMGMNHFGEISYLSKMAEPDIVLINNVGVSHIENLGSREGILKAKCEIFDGLKVGGIRIINGDDDMLSTIEDSSVIRFGMDKGFDIYGDNIVQNGIDGVGFVLHIGDNSIEVNIPVPGKHMVSNALAAASVGKAMGLSPEEIKKGIEGFVPSGGRLDKIVTDKYVIINDAYNANTASAMAGLEVLKNAEGEKCAILGDMFEMGSFAPEEHKKVGAFAASLGIDKLIAIGELSRNTYEAAVAGGIRQAFCFDSQEQFFEKLPDIISEGATILVKASHGMHFEKTVEKLRSE